MSDKSRCPCGGVILADLEDWETPLCFSCYSDLIEINQTAKSRITDLEARLAEANRKVEELEQNDNVVMKNTAMLSEENAKLMALLGEASSVIDELLTAEAEENNKKVKLVDGIKYYPITGRYRTNAAFYKLDEFLTKLQEVTK